jgi:hypothetical protein
MINKKNAPQEGQAEKTSMQSLQDCFSGPLFNVLFADVATKNGKQIDMSLCSGNVQVSLTPCLNTPESSTCSVSDLPATPNVDEVSIEGHYDDGFQEPMQGNNGNFNIEEAKERLYPDRTEYIELVNDIIAYTNNVKEFIAAVDCHGKEIVDLGSRLLTQLQKHAPYKCYDIFRRDIDEVKLGQCLAEIFKTFFGPQSKVKLEGEYNEPVDLIALFFVLVEWLKLGDDNFSERGKTSFFEFVKEHVGESEITVDVRTFRNHLKNMEDFRRKLKSEYTSSTLKGEQWKGDLYINDFRKVVDVFRQTHFCQELKKRRKL